MENTCRLLVCPSQLDTMASILTFCLSSLLLILSGDIETNPGPKKGGGDKGPSADDKIRELGSALNEYEAKIQGNRFKRLSKKTWVNFKLSELEKEIKEQRENYDKKLDEISTKLQEITSGDQVKQSDFETFKTELNERLTDQESQHSQR